MPNLTPSWATCRLVGIWLSGDHTAMRAGNYRITYPRAVNSKQRAMVPAGLFATGQLNTNPGTPLPSGDTDLLAANSIDLYIPATDDPDIPQAIQATVVISFADGADSETYIIDAPSGGTVRLDQLVPTAASVQTSNLKVGVAGGVATLDSSGKVPAAQLPTSNGGGGGGTQANIWYIGGVWKYYDPVTQAWTATIPSSAPAGIVTVLIQGPSQPTVNQVPVWSGCYYTFELRTS